MPDPRVAPLTAPYDPELRAAFDRIMPKGVPPLALFRTLARVPRVWERFLAGALLTPGPLSLRPTFPPPRRCQAGCCRSGCRDGSGRPALR